MACPARRARKFTIDSKDVAALDGPVTRRWFCRRRLEMIAPLFAFSSTNRFTSEFMNQLAVVSDQPGQSISHRK